MSTTVETAMSLEELMRAALDARAEVARLGLRLAEARVRANQVERDLAAHPEIDEDRVFFAGHVFEWGRGDAVQIWPCRHVGRSDGPTRDFA